MHKFTGGKRLLRTKAWYPSASRTDDNVVWVKIVHNKDRCLNIGHIASQVGLPKPMVHKIVTEHLNMQKMSAKLVPKICLMNRNKTCPFICQDLFVCLATEPDFLG